MSAVPDGLTQTAATNTTGPTPAELGSVVPSARLSEKMAPLPEARRKQPVREKCQCEPDAWCGCVDWVTEKNLPRNFIENLVGGGELVTLLSESIS